MPVQPLERAREADVTEQRIAQEIKEAPPSAVLITARIAYATCGAIITYLIAKLIQIEEQTARELAILNAGLAYYTHDAAGKIISAINGIYVHLGRSKQ